MANQLWSPTEPLSGIQPIQTTNAKLPSTYQVGQSPLFGQAHPLGTIVRIQDTASNPFGAGEAIYLEGVASTAVGSLVVYDPLNGTTTLAPNTANLDQPVAVALSANVGSQFGWYQIAGVAKILKNASPVSKNAVVYLSATVGSVAGTQANGKQILNARSVASAASAASFVNVLIQRPFAQGQTV